MDIDLSFSITYSIDFTSIPDGAEEYAELIRSNAIMVIRNRIGEYISNLFSTSFDEVSIQQIIENIVLTECAVNSSVAQSEKTQGLFAELSVSVIVTASISKTQDEILNQIKTMAANEIQQTTMGRD